MSHSWSLPHPHIINVDVEESHLDSFGHVNNAMYLNWLEQCAWSHSAAVGLPNETCVALRRGMAVRRSEIDYLRAAFPGDRLLVGNWVTEVGRLRAVRQYEILRLNDAVTILRARMEFVCINLDTGAPARFPPEFASYRVEPEVQAALDGSHPAGDTLKPD